MSDGVGWGGVIFSSPYCLCIAFGLVCTLLLLYTNPCVDVLFMLIAQGLL